LFCFIFYWLFCFILCFIFYCFFVLFYDLFCSVLFFTGSFVLFYVFNIIISYRTKTRVKDIALQLKTFQALIRKHKKILFSENHLSTSQAQAIKSSQLLLEDFLKAKATRKLTTDIY